MPAAGCCPWQTALLQRLEMALSKLVAADSRAASVRRMWSFKFIKAENLHVCPSTYTRPSRHTMEAFEIMLPTIM
jgi:hypothetical protein